LTANQIYTSIAEPPPAFDSDARSQGLSLMVAAGPFTTKDNLDYKPLRDLFEVIRRRVPDYLLLAGPFVDASHNDIQACRIDKTFEDFFDELIKLIEAKLDSIATKILIVPSLRDVQHANVFPQPPFFESDDHSQKKISYLPNPCTVCIGNKSFGITTTDILTHLAGTELVKRSDQSQTQDPSSHLVQYLIDQQSYYPLFPPDSKSQLDTTHYEALAMPYTPDVLLFSSLKPHFVNEISGVLCVNTGPLTRNSGGTYAYITVHPETTDASKPKSNIAQRTRVDIIRI